MRFGDHQAALLQACDDGMCTLDGHAVRAPDVAYGQAWRLPQIAQNGELTGCQLEGRQIGRKSAFPLPSEAQKRQCRARAQRAENMVGHQ